MTTTLTAPAALHPFLPDYAGGSIANLIATLAGHLGARDWPVEALRDHNLGLPPPTSRVLLLIVDGLGDAQLARASAQGALRRHRRGTLTSVFPSTTASAITTLMTGLTPAQHGLPGWHVYFPEIGQTAAVLPFRLRAPLQPLAMHGISAASVFDYPALGDRLPVKSFAVVPERIANSEFNRAHTGRAHRLGYGSVEHLFQALLNTLRTHTGPCFIYGYYADFDAVAHEHGVSSAKADRLLHLFDDALALFLENARGLDVSVMVTADHGFIDTPLEHSIVLEQHPALASMLRVPLCGERRAAYAYVRPESRAAFEAYVQEHFAEQIWLHRSESLLEMGWFGPGPEHPRLRERIGDYTLVMRDNWTIKDWLPGEARHHHVGVHGGVTREEMVVPLVVAAA